MPVILFCCLPFEGHVRPVAGVAHALGRIGCCDVDFAAMEDSRRTVEALAPAATFVSLGHTSEEQRRQAQVVFDTSRSAGTMAQRAQRAAGTFTSERGWCQGCAGESGARGLRASYGGRTCWS
jgi:UDP:flavonoid glycosyltransferase YjiC (YdhE family)